MDSFQLGANARTLLSVPFQCYIW